MPSTCRNLIGCLDGIWYFGRADVEIDPPPQRCAGSHHFLHPLFRLLDRDGDGHVNLEEMRSTVGKLGKNDVSYACLAGLVESATRGTSDTFGFAQFTALYESVFKEVEAEEEDQEVVEAFHVYDRNCDGFISASELATVLTELGLVAATSDVAAHVDKCQTFIDRVDSDGNGLVDLQEFKAMLMANHFPSSIPCLA